MSRDAYELLALGARYVFAGLMVLIARRIRFEIRSSCRASGF